MRGRLPPPPSHSLTAAEGRGNVSERQITRYYYSQRLDSLRRWRVRYCVPTDYEQRQPAVVVDIRASYGYPWCLTHTIHVAYWDLYRLCAIAFSAYFTAFGLAAFFAR